MLSKTMETANDAPEMFAVITIGFCGCQLSSYQTVTSKQIATEITKRAQKAPPIVLTLSVIALPKELRPIARKSL